jgi:hypothetical protein
MIMVKLIMVLQHKSELYFGSCKTTLTKQDMNSYGLKQMYENMN